MIVGAVASVFSFYGILAGLLLLLGGIFALIKEKPRQQTTVA